MPTLLLPLALAQGVWNRHVLDDQLKWGHAVWCADLDGDGDDPSQSSASATTWKSHPGRGCGGTVFNVPRRRPFRHVENRCRHNLPGQTLSDKPGERLRRASPKAVNAQEGKWERHILDDGGIAVEDLTAGDLFGTGRIDIVAVRPHHAQHAIYRNLRGNRG